MIEGHNALLLTYTSPPYLLKAQAEALAHGEDILPHLGGLLLRCLNAPEALVPARPSWIGVPPEDPDKSDTHFHLQSPI